MKLSLDRAFRLIWLVVGGLLLLLMVAGGLMVLGQVIGNAGAGEEAVRVARESGAPREEARAVRYGAPHSIRGTATRIILVDGGDGRSRRDSYSSGYGSDESAVNVAFLGAAGARLLLDRPAFIRDIRYPAEARGSQDRADTLQTWITYVMALEDSDRSGALDARDAAGLYVTDVEGRNLRPVVRPPLRYRSHHTLEGGRMLVYALEPASGVERQDEDRMRQRAFIYDIAASQLSPYTALDSVTARAGQILAR